MAAKKSNYSVLSIPGKKAGDCKFIYVDDLEFAFRWCPPDKFMMGPPESQHEVKLTKGFWIMETPVTVGMFKEFVKDSSYEPNGAPYVWKKGISCRPHSEFSWLKPGYTQDDNYPVTCIRWEAAVAFCNWLKKKTELTMQLPTEAEWEYACRAGRKDSFEECLDEMAWHFSNSAEPGKQPHPHPVATRKPNAWGIYDMLGNVWEWCRDWYEKDYPRGCVIDPTGPQDGTHKVFRGGSWATKNVLRCRPASRDCYASYEEKKNSGNFIGFRVVCECKQQ